MGKRTQGDINASERFFLPHLVVQGEHSEASNIEHRIHAKVLDFSVARGHHEGLKDGSEAKIKTGAEQARAGLMVMGVKHGLSNSKDQKREGFLFYGFARRNNTSNDQFSF